MNEIFDVDCRVNILDLFEPKRNNEMETNLLADILNVYMYVYYFINVTDVHYVSMVTLYYLIGRKLENISRKV